MRALVGFLGGAVVASAALVLWAEWEVIVGHFRQGGKVTEVVRW